MDGFNNQRKHHHPAGWPSGEPAPRTAGPHSNLLKASLSERAAIFANLSKSFHRLARPITARTGAKSAAAIILVALALLIYAFLFQARPQAPDYLTNSSLVKTPRQQQVAQQQIMDLAAKVGKLIALPQGEIPAVASITDVSKLAGQVFFAKAQDGDKVLIYSQAKQAYLYRPSTNKIINISAVDTGGNLQGPSPASDAGSGGSMSKTLVRPADNATR